MLQGCFSATGTGRKPAPEHSGPQTGVKVHLPTGQQSKAYSQDNTGGASGKSLNVFEWPSQSPDLNPI